MEIQWSLVLFTALSGAGAWLVACAGLDAFKGLAKKTVVPAVVTGIVLIIVGGIASATHLSHVDRIMAVLAHPAPGIFLEAVLLGIDVVVAVAFLVLYRRGASEGVLKGLGVVAVAMAAIFSYACGSSYMMSSQLAWNTVALPLGYLGTALAAGTALWYLLCAARREEGAALSFAATETLVGAAAALVTSLAYGLLAGIVGLIVRRKNFGATDAADDDIESMMSKEAAYYVNNLIMIVFAVLLAYMTVSSALPSWLPFGGQSLSAGTYNAIARPLGIAYLAVLAICPLLGWRRTDKKAFWRNARVPALCALVLFIVLMIYFATYLLPSYQAMIDMGGTQASGLLEQGNPIYYNGLAVVGFAVASLLFFSALFMAVRSLKRVDGAKLRRRLGVTPIAGTT